MTATWPGCDMEMRCAETEGSGRGPTTDCRLPICMLKKTHLQWWRGPIGSGTCSGRWRGLKSAAGLLAAVLVLLAGPRGLSVLAFSYIFPEARQRNATGAGFSGMGAAAIDGSCMRRGNCASARDFLLAMFAAPPRHPTQGSRICFFAPFHSGSGMDRLIRGM